MTDITPAAAIKRVHEIFDRTLVKRGPDTGKRSGLDVSSVLEVMPLLDALSTPPADDVREALYEEIAVEMINRIGWQRISTDLVRGIVREWERRTSTEVRPRGTVTDAEVEAAAKAMFEDGTGLPGDYTWAQMVTEDPTRADIWRADARRVLGAAREARS